LDSVFKADKEIQTSLSDDKKYVYKQRGSENKKMYSDEYIRTYHQKLGAQIERRLRSSISQVASFWYSAWVEAGQPKINDLVLMPDAKERLKTLEDEQNQIKAGTWKGREE
jgi:hypothetical protein